MSSKLTLTITARKTAGLGFIDRMRCYVNQGRFSNNNFLASTIRSLDDELVLYCFWKRTVAKMLKLQTFHTPGDMSWRYRWLMLYAIRK
jgi:hypothetical protein